MRLKNVKGASDIVSNSKYIINEPTNYKGKFNDIFNNKNNIHLEIGMGKGRFIIENAIKYPNINFIGLEKYASVQVRAINKLSELELPNLKLLNIDALELDTIFDKEIDTIYLNFSDPWPKKRHSDRRLSSKIFLDKYLKISNGNVHIIMKTDNRKLFEYSLISFISNGYIINNVSLDLYSDDIKDNIKTEYEEKFSSNGDTIYMVDVTRHS